MENSMEEEFLKRKIYQEKECGKMVKE